MGAPVKSLVVQKKVIGGKTIKSATISTSHFMYTNFSTGVQTLAQGTFWITNSNGKNIPGRGTFSYLISDVLTNKFLDGTVAQDGQIYPLVLASGSTTMSGF